MSSDGLAFTFTDGIRAGVCVMATVGVLGTFTIFLLLIHLLHVTLTPILSNFQYLFSRRGPRPATSAFTDRRFISDNPPVTPPVTPLTPSQGRWQTMPEERMFLPMQLGLFIICLFLSDFVQALGVLIQARWAYLGGIEDGMACWMQAGLVTFGDVASGVWNAIISIHTFSTICLGKRMGTPVLLITLICGWTFPIMMNVIGAAVFGKDPNRGPYYGVAGAWCFITNAYGLERALLHYLPMLIAAIIITLMYIPVWLTLRGNLLITPSQHGYRLTFRSTSPSTTSGSSQSGGNSPQANLRRIARKMLWYPLAYNITLLPVLICRFIQLNGQTISLPILLASITLLFSMGISNVCIYFFTRNLGGRPWYARPLLANRDNMEIYVERTTVNEVGPDNGRIRDRASHIKSHSSPWNSDVVVISPHYPSPSSGETFFPGDGAKAIIVKQEELRSPTPTKFDFLHDLIFKPRTSLSPDSPNPDHGGVRLERMGTYNDKDGQQTFQDTLRTIHSRSTHDDSSV